MEYVSKVRLEINGQEITDFNAVTEKEQELYKEVPMMNKTGHVAVRERYGVEVDYGIPKDAPEFDFATVRNGTLVIDRDNGTRVLYTGVFTLSIGAATYDGVKETTRKIVFGAEKRSLS